jgi:hypothetical protein
MVTKWNLKRGLAQRLRLLSRSLLLAAAAAPIAGLAVTADPNATGSLIFAREADTQALCTRVEAALAAHQFASLDATERAMRDPNVRLVGGNSQLYHYYGALAAYSGANLFLCHSGLAFNQKQQLLDRWLAADPKSIAAHIALSQFWTNAGWSARGDSYADEVTDQQWQFLAASLAKAKSALVETDGRADPHMYYVLIEIARGQPDPRPILDQLYASAVHSYPNYFHYYSQRVNLLQERWYGRPDELRSYSASLLESPGGDAGVVAYSYVSFNLMLSNSRPTLLQTAGLSWPIIKSAYTMREKLYGLRNRDWNALFNLALAAVDRDTARATLTKIHGKWDPDVWKEQKYFEDAVSWTMESQK